MTGESRPPPMVPAECRLDKLPYMPVTIESLLNSDLWQQSSGEEFKAAFALWMRSWKQEPGASLPTNERVLAGLAGVGISQWRKLKDMALHNWVECSDGRLYHPFVARRGLEAWIERLRFQKRSAKGNRQRGHTVKSEEEFDAEIERAIEYLRRLDPDAAGSKVAKDVSDEVSKQGEEAPPSRSLLQGGENAPKHKHKHKHKHKQRDNQTPALASATAETSPADADADAGVVIWNDRLSNLRSEFSDVLGTARTANAPDELIALEAAGYSWAEIERGAKDFLLKHRHRMSQGWRGRVNSFGHPGIKEAVAKFAAQRPAPKKTRAELIGDALKGRISWDETVHGAWPTEAEIAAIKGDQHA